MTVPVTSDLARIAAALERLSPPATNADPATGHWFVWSAKSLAAVPPPRTTPIGKANEGKRIAFESGQVKFQNRKVQRNRPVTDNWRYKYCSISPAPCRRTVNASCWQSITVDATLWP